jgi:alkylated DNA repair protein (DNA oxidative demethylase)
MARIQRHHQPDLFGEADRQLPDGFHYLAGYFDPPGQLALLEDVRKLLDRAPLFQQTMPRTGAPLSVRTSNAGDFGWVTDRDGGYRYQPSHPVTGEKWPAIPARLLQLWADATGERQPPNLCLINYYDAEAKLGLHQDRGEGSMDAPVVSVSLGDDAVFVVGGLTRKDPMRRLELRSGDVVWFGGPARLIFHGVEGIRPGSSTLLAEGGRINLTLRRVDRGLPAEDTAPAIIM